jgi:hypothetical protein
MGGGGGVITLRAGLSEAMKKFENCPPSESICAAGTGTGGGRG